MNRYPKPIGLLLALMLLLSACSRVSIPESSPSLTIPVPDPSTPAPGIQPSTQTALPAAETGGISTPTAALPTGEDVETEPLEDHSNKLETNLMNIQIGDQILTATLLDNSSAAALKKALREGPITINMRDYGGMEKVGSLGLELPRNDEQITTDAGDIILYQGNALVIYYAPNSWNFTRLGKINDLSKTELKEILGDGNVSVTLSLPQE